MDGARLNEEDEKAIVEKLLAYHPHSEDKIGCGLESIMVSFASSSSVSVASRIFQFRSISAMSTPQGSSDSASTKTERKGIFSFFIDKLDLTNFVRNVSFIIISFIVNRCDNHGR